MKELFILLDSYAKLSPRLRGHLRVILRRHEFKKKDIILPEGKICKRIWFIEKGLIRIYTRGKNEVTDWIQCENHIFIVIDSFFKQERSAHAIEAVEDTIVWSISFEELKDTVKRFPQFAKHQDKIKSDYYALFYKRQALLNGMTTIQKYQWFINTEPELFQRLPAKVIYTYLRISHNKYFEIRRELAGKTKTPKSK